MFCPKCGSEIISGAKFCSKCGQVVTFNEQMIDAGDQLLNDGTEVEAGGSPEKDEPVVSNPPQKKKKSKAGVGVLVASLLGICLIAGGAVLLFGKPWKTLDFSTKQRISVNEDVEQKSEEIALDSDASERIESETSSFGNTDSTEADQEDIESETDSNKEVDDESESIVTVKKDPNQDECAENIDDQDESKDDMKSEVDEEFEEDDEESDDKNDDDEEVIVPVVPTDDSSEKKDKENEDKVVVPVVPDPLANIKVGDFITFGTYEQDNKRKNGAEPIEWEVLDENKNGYLLISKYVLDCQPYHDDDDKEKVTWETCSLRTWLNDDFYNTAFSAEEKKRINIVTLVNEDNKFEETKGGKNTNDRIFVLSVYELKELFAFDYVFEEYDDDEYDGFEGFCQKLIISPTKYAESIDVFATNISESDYYEGSYTNPFGLKEYGYSKDCIGKKGTEWWTRTPGEDQGSVCSVNWDGNVSDHNIFDCDTWMGQYGCGVRPALYIKK